MMDLLNMSVSEMAGISFDCSCGQEHKIEINNIIIGSGVINKLPDVLKEFAGRKVFIVQDANTYKAAGGLVENLLKEDFILSSHVFSSEHLIPDETALGKLLIQIPDDTSIILGVGSGTINDLCRYLSYKLHKPYVIVGTAPSMDGYASVVSPLVVDGVKTTYSAVYPYAIIADIDILKNAPMYMLHAGFGDIIGKYTALADWHIAEILNGEYFCNLVEKLVLKAVNTCANASSDILSRDKKAIENITEALILSGLSIGMTGTSRPASGEEHHLSHCWEAMFTNQVKIYKWLHGNNVGVGTGIIIEAYKYLSKLNIDEIYNSGSYAMFNKEKWVDNLYKVYGKTAANIVEFKQDAIPFDKKSRMDRMNNIYKNWGKIKEICDTYLPKSEDIRNTFINAGAVYNPCDLGIDKGSFKRSFIAAKDIRRRYGILQLLEDIGKIYDAAEYIANIYY